MILKYTTATCSMIAILFSAHHVSADDAPLVADYSMGATYSHFGSHGLLQMPNARFGQAGDFAVGWTRIAPYRFLTINVTPFPWLEGAVRYTRQGDRIYQLAAAIGSPQDNVDKGIDLKLRLVREDVWTPQVAVGIHDLGGTGLFGSEYLAASKRFGSVDLTAGLGWGRLGSQGHFDNPAKMIGESFEVRSASTGRGGTFSVDDWFSGDSVSIFAGAEYQSPIPGLVAKVEYDGNDYSRDASDISASSPWNFGVVYRLNSVMDLHLGYERGDTLSAGVVIRTNFANAQQPVKFDEKPPVSNDVRDNETLAEQLGDSSFNVQSIRTSDTHSMFQLRGSFNRYPDDAEGLGVIADEVRGNLQGRDLSVVTSTYGMPLNGWEIPYEVVANQAVRDLDRHEVETQVQRVDPPSEPRGTQQLNEMWDQKWSLAPNLEQSFQSPEAFWIYRLNIAARGELIFNESTSVLTEMSASIADNYDELRLQESSALPPVRTNVRDYLRDNREFYLERLQATHFERFGQSWYGQAYFGHLEKMFSGYGAELLYRPFDSWWSLGVDLNRVWQRDFDSLGGLQDYAVNTGHVSANFELPWDGIRVRTSFGRYLAGDDGVTLQLARAFDNGFEVGVWATQTDVSAEQFGEGSFDKGAYLRIPLDVFTVQSTRAVGSIGWRPMQRDGGQKLARKFDLYTMSRDRGHDGDIFDWSKFLK